MAEKRRITYIHQHFKLLSEGGGTRSWEFARRLAADGHTVTVICAGDQSEQLEIDSVRIIRVQAAYSNGMGMVQRSVSFLRFVQKALVSAIRTPADIVVASSTPLTVSIPGVVGAFFQRATFIFEVRDLWPSVPVRLGYLRSPILINFAQWLERWAYGKAKRIIALSPAMSEGVLQTTPTADVRMIPNACDTVLFDKPQEERAEIRADLGWAGIRAIYAGSFGETYRIPWIVRLAGESSLVKFQILGDGHATKEARQTATKYHLEVASLLPGSLSKEEVASRIAASDIVVSSINNHPALHGNSLNKVFDALAAGRPIVFNHDGWLSNLVTTAGAGWRLADDVVEAAAMLDAIAADPQQLEAASEAARHLARDFDRDILYKKFRRALID